MQPMWQYYTAEIPGNFHKAVEEINVHHPDWDVVTLQYLVSLHVTIVVHRAQVGRVERTGK
jgi:hypothetical protein